MKRTIILLLTIVFLSTGINLFGDTTGTAKNEIPLKNGMKIKKGSTFETYENGTIKKIILAADWTDKIMEWTMKGNSEVTMYSNGAPEKFILAKDWLDHHDGKRIKANTDLLFFENGNFKQFTLSKNWIDTDTGMMLKGKTAVIFYESGNSKECTIAQDWKDKDGKILKANTDVIWDAKNIIRIFVISKNWGSFPAGTKVFIQNDGKPKVYDPDKDKLE